MDESEVKAVNLHDGLDSTLMILQHRIKSGAGQENLAVIKQYQTLPELTCYAGQLNQVFMNILSNAIDAIEDYNEQRSPEAIAAQPCEIHISTALIDNWVEIRIRDNGPGIPEEVQSRLFDPFFTTKPVGKGTGMGLAISYQVVVDKHGGLLMCESAPGRGTEFIIELPLNCETQTGSRDPILKR
jgi:signal transduction histidine kinase